MVKKKSIKNINLVIFNEDYWNHGLIETQNIKPLKFLCVKHGTELRLVSFTSIYSFVKNRVQIRKRMKELKEDGIKTINFPVLFIPTKYMILRRWLVPFFFINVYFYIKFLNNKDSFKNDIYLCRSYPISLGFFKFFSKKNYLNFDPRTDWIEENINLGLFKENSKSVNYWMKMELEILSSFRHTFFISEQFKSNVLSRHRLIDNNEKFLIQYNVVSQNIKSKNIGYRPLNFLYTGSLGHWNNLFVYFDFFLKIHKYFPESNLIICTSTPMYKIDSIINSGKYISIKNSVQVYYNLPSTELPEYYKQCKYGLQLMTKTDSRVGVKFVEYIMAGLIPITNENVLGAVEIVKKYKIGCVIDSENINSEIRIKLMNARSLDPSDPSHQRLLSKISQETAYPNLYSIDEKSKSEEH